MSRSKSFVHDSMRSHFANSMGGRGVPRASNTMERVHGLPLHVTAEPSIQRCPMLIRSMLLSAAIAAAVLSAGAASASEPRQGASLPQAHPANKVFGPVSRGA